MRRSLAWWILASLMLVQFGLAHTAICSRFMAPQPPAAHCHSSQHEPAPARQCHDVAGCFEVCGSLNTPWTFTAKAKLLDQVLAGAVPAEVQLSKTVALHISLEIQGDLELRPYLLWESPPAYIVGSSLLI